MTFNFCIRQGLERYEMVEAEIMPMTTWGPANPEQARVTIRDWAVYYSVEYIDHYSIAETTLQYLLWRDQLQLLVDSLPPHNFVGRSPFCEIFDNEIVIWPTAAQNLLVDFSQWKEQAKANPEATFYEIYERLRACLTHALNNRSEARHFALKPDWDKEGESWMSSYVAEKRVSGNLNFKFNDDNEI